MEEIYNQITKLIKEHDNIIIMTHKYPDFDGLSSAFCLQSIISEFNKKSVIVKSTENKDKSIDKAYKMLDDNNIKYNAKSIVDEYITENTLLFVLDTHTQPIVENENLLNIKNKVVIDHHIINKNRIKNCKLSYINPKLSSTVEFMSGYLKYLNKTVNSYYATFMLVGLEIDTNNFNHKTTYKTYETAAHISKIGADNILKQILFKETKETYIKRNKVIEKSTMINENMAMCLCEDEIFEKKDLSSIADDLLQFEGVEASFSLGKIDDELIGISARSFDKINVEKIMSKLNGGGHRNEAATTLKCSLKEAVKQLFEAIGGINESDIY